MATDDVSLLPLPPGKLGWPLIGETLRFKGNEEEFMEERHKKYGDVFLTHLILKPTIVVRGEDNLREMFAQENKSLSISWPPSIEMLCGPDNLLNQKGEAHKRSRVRMMSAMNKTAIDKLVPRMYKIISERVSKWAASPSGVNISEEAVDLTYCLNVALLLGGDPASERMRRCIDLVHICEKGCVSLPYRIPFTPMYYAWHARRELWELFQAEIDERKERLKVKDAAADLDVLETMITAKDKDGNTMSDAEIKGQLLVLFSAGSQTTAGSLYCFLCNVGQHPEILERLYDEQLQVLGEKVDRMPTPDELKSCDYMHNVLNETLRIESPGAFIFRVAAKSMKCGDFQIPRGYNVILNLLSNSRSEKHFSNPYDFNPDRWEDFHHDRANMFKFMPFWQGVRLCLGKHFAQAVRHLFASEIAKKYTFELSGDVGKFHFLAIVPLPAGKTMMKLKAR